jgi:hypothetical protein
MMEKGRFFNKCCSEKWVSAYRKLKLGPYFSPHISVNSRWIKDLNIIPETFKLVQEKVGNTLEAIA